MAAKRATLVDMTPVRVVILSLDSHLGTAIRAAETELRRTHPNLSLAFHPASEFNRQSKALARAIEDIGKADFVLASMLFIEDHIKAVLPALQARRESFDAIVGAMSASEVVQLTRLDRFDMSKPASGPIALMKRLRGGSGDKAKSGEKQMKTLRRLPKILRYIPGMAQDVRAYFVTMQYLLAGSEKNIANAVRFLVDRYAAGPRAQFLAFLRVGAVAGYPAVHLGLVHDLLERAGKTVCASRLAAVQVGEDRRHADPAVPRF
jgi:magnesium chelatase subunit H